MASCPAGWDAFSTADTFSWKKKYQKELDIEPKPTAIPRFSPGDECKYLIEK